MRGKGWEKKNLFSSSLSLPISNQSGTPTEELNYIIQSLSTTRHMHFIIVTISKLYFAKHNISRKRISYYKQNICQSVIIFFFKTECSITISNHYSKVMKMMSHDDKGNNNKTIFVLVWLNWNMAIIMIEIGRNEQWIPTQ